MPEHVIYLRAAAAAKMRAAMAAEARRCNGRPADLGGLGGPCGVGNCGVIADDALIVDPVCGNGAMLVEALELELFST